MPSIYSFYHPVSLRRSPTILALTCYRLSPSVTLSHRRVRRGNKSVSHISLNMLHVFPGRNSFYLLFFSNINVVSLCWAMYEHARVTVCHRNPKHTNHISNNLAAFFEIQQNICGLSIHLIPYLLDCKKKKVIAGGKRKGREGKLHDLIC